MEWHDDAIMLGVRPHGENHAIAEVFTPSAGRVVALVHGGQGRQKQPLLQPGNGVSVVWKGRSEDSLGHFALELTEPRAATLMHDALAVAGLTTITSMLSLCLPERQSLPRLYDATQILIGLLEEGDIWPVALVRWELGLLADLGFGIDLESCAATGTKLEDGADLVFVSPKSGRAVSYEAGLPFRDGLLPLPPFLIDRGEPTKPDLGAAFRLTGHFIEEQILAPSDRLMPPARQRMVDRVTRV